MIDAQTTRKTFQSENEVAGTTGASFCVVNPHCLEYLVRLSETFEVKPSIEIVDEAGISLWPAGVPVSRALHERTSRRRLRQPLELTLEVGDGVSMTSVIRDCLALIERNQALETLAGRNGVREVLLGLRSMVLPGPLRLLLTSVRELRKHDYETSLAAMILSAGLARRAGFSERDAGHLIVAALVADIGEMYIDPAFLDDSRELTPSEWRSIVWHPCIGEEFLKEFAEFPSVVNDGVLHHHERFGGHGYPFQVIGDRLGLVHTMLGTVDTVAAIVMRGGAGMADRVSLALQIAPGEFLPPVVRLVTKLLDGLDEPSPDLQFMGIEERVWSELERMHSARREATRLLREAHGLSVINAADLALNLLTRMDERLGTQRVHALLQKGISENDAATLSMIRMLPDEISWRLRNLARNVYLQAAQSGDTKDLLALGGLIDLLDPISSDAPPGPLSASRPRDHSAW